jgi:hypothetical protein
MGRLVVEEEAVEVRGRVLPGSGSCGAEEVGFC